jgi:YesN/AraC family two-component response regulator
MISNSSKCFKERVSWEKYGIEEVYTANSMKKAIEIMGKR